MNIQVLPNWGKKLGLIIFILGIAGLFFLIAFAVVTSEQGATAYDSGYAVGENLRNLFHHKLIGKITVNKSINILILFGMIVYLMSKEKIEDEFIERLRLESYQLTLLILSFFLMGMFFLGNSVSAAWCLFLFFGIYLIIFAIKKRLAV